MIASFETRRGRMSDVQGSRAAKGRRRFVSRARDKDTGSPGAQVESREPKVLPSLPPNNTATPSGLAISPSQPQKVKIRSGLLKVDGLVLNNNKTVKRLINWK